MNKSILGILFFFSFLTGNAQFSTIPYLVPGALYSQAFNQLPTSGSINLPGKGPHALDQVPLSLNTLNGWQIMLISGSQSNTNFLTGTGSGTGSGIYSFGPSGNTNRALGSLASGTGIYAFGAVFENGTGVILNKITIGFTATQWRKGGSANKNTWRFGYQTGPINHIDTNNLIRVAELDINSIHSTSGTATLNGQLPANQYLVTATLANMRWQPGEKLIIRWDDADETGSDDGMAVDDFSFVAISEIKKPSVTSITVDSIGTRYARIKAYINDGLSNTNVLFEYDTVRNFTHPVLAANISKNLIPAGSGNTLVEAFINHLIPGKNYYARLVATNQISQVVIDTIHFQTHTGPPEVSTDSIVVPKHNEFMAYAKLISTNGSAILEKGFCWSEKDTPSITDNVLIATTQDSIFTVQLTGLPYNQTIHLRAFSSNSKGLSYGNILRVQTPVTILSFLSTTTYTNQDTLLYRLKLKKPVANITANHFTVESFPKNNARILSVYSENDSSYLLKIYTDSTDALITPVFHHHPQHQPFVADTLYAGSTTISDKTRPVIRKITIPDRPYKTGDSIPVTIHINPDSSLLILTEGKISNYPIHNLYKHNDSTLFAHIIAAAGGKEIAAQENHTATILIKDIAGNANSISTFIIEQNNDAIDHTKPFIKEIILPERKKYKAGDTLHFLLTLNEEIICDTIFGKPVLSITIGTRIKNPSLNNISGKKILQFSYRVQPEESDLDGIRIANTITLNNAVIKDMAGNILHNSIPNAGIISDLLIDAVQPVVTAVTTPPAKVYGTGDSLIFIVHFSKQIQLSSYELPYLEIVLGNEKQKVQYLSGAPGNTISFLLVIQKGMLDKNGIVLSGIIFNDTSIRDDVGNAIIPLLKSIGALSAIHIDGIAPQFTNFSRTHADVCSKGSISLDNLLQVFDEEKAGGITWTIIEAPQKGFIKGLPFTTRQGIDILEPKDATYTNTNGESGTDDCIVEISDGINRIRKKITLQIHAEIKGNQIKTNQIICSGTMPETLTGENVSGGNGAYQFIWQFADLQKPNVFQSYPQNHIYPSFQPGNLSVSTLFRRIVVSGGCADTSNTVEIEVKNKGLWLGKQNNSWHTGTNWCGTIIPDRETDVFIQTPNQVVQITDSAFCNSLYLLNKSKLHISGILVYQSGIIGQQSIQAVQGTVMANGKQPQWLPAQAFEDNSLGTLIVKGDELNISDSLYIYRSSGILKGKLITYNLLVLHDTAIILPNAPGVQLRGSIRKYYTLHNNFIVHPFKSMIPVVNHDSLTQHILHSGSFASFSNSKIDSFLTISNSSIPSFQKKIRWKKLEADTLLHTPLWENGKGISAFEPFKEKINSRIVFTGNPIIGDQEISFTPAKDTQYQLTGNPYIATVLSKHISIGDAIGNYFWVWDSSLSETGGYAAKAFNGNHVLQPMQGFIIKTMTGKDYFIRFAEQAKMLKPLPDSITDIIENTYQLALSFYNDQYLLDRLLLIDSDTANTRYEAADAEKLFNQYYNLYSLSRDGVPLAIDARSFNERTNISLGIQTKEKGNYTIKFSRVWLPKKIQLELHDFFTGNITKILPDSSYHFQVTNDSSSTGEKRFVIRTPIPPEPQEEPIQIKLFPVPAQNQLTVYFKSYKPGISWLLIKNSNGQLLRKENLGQQQEGNFQVSLQGLLKGQYILEIHCGPKFIATAFIKL